MTLQYPEPSGTRGKYHPPLWPPRNYWTNSVIGKLCPFSHIQFPLHKNLNKTILSVLSSYIWWTSIVVHFHGHRCIKSNGLQTFGKHWVSEFQWGTMIGCHLCNKSSCEIFSPLNIPQLVISGIITMWKRLGVTTAQPQGDRPSKITEHGQQILMYVACRDKRNLYWHNLCKHVCVCLGTYVTQVTATDADDPTYGNSARIVYSILHGQPYFSVDPKTGDRTAAGTFLLQSKNNVYSCTNRIQTSHEIQFISWYLKCFSPVLRLKNKTSTTKTSHHVNMTVSVSIAGQCLHWTVKTYSENIFLV